MGLRAMFFAKKDAIDASKIEVNSCCCGGESENSASVKEQLKKIEESHCCCGGDDVKEVIEKVEESHCCCCGSEEDAAEEVEESHCCSQNEPKTTSKFLRVFTYGFGNFLEELAVNFLIGVAIAALISAFVPEDFFVTLGLDSGIVSMLAMIIIGLPMYVCSTSSIPIALSLITKGLSFGSAFVFLFVGPCTNIASILLINKSLGKKITAIYLSSVVVCSIIMGYILDFIIDFFGIEPLSLSLSSSHGMGVVSIILACVLAVLLARCIVVKIMRKYKNPKSSGGSCGCSCG